MPCPYAIVARTTSIGNLFWQSL